MYSGQNYGRPLQPGFGTLPGQPFAHHGPPPSHIPPRSFPGGPVAYLGAPGHVPFPAPAPAPASAPAPAPAAPATSPGGAHVGAHDPMLIATNPDAFAHMFREQLASLTFNSKPIITNLTIVAHEHVHRMAGVVAKCLDDHIMQSHPSIRLPSLYLLDSICKNIGQPYSTMWAERIVTIFLESYRLVDQPTKMRMEELLATWKDAGTGGRPLFTESTQFSIERALFGSQGMPPSAHKPTPPPTAVQQQSHLVPDDGKARAVESIDRLLALGSQELHGQPNNRSIQERLDSLRQLKQVLQTAALSAEEMAQVHAQLDSLTAASSRQALPPVPPPLQPAVRTDSPAPPSQFSTSVATALAGLGNLGALTAAPGSTTLATLPAPPPSASVAAAGNSAAASALIASLMQAGLLPGGGAAAPAVAAKAADQDDDYIQSIMALDITISGPSFSKEPPAIELLLHKHLPLQCRQCANRYPIGDKGKRKMDEHLDWHFTQNRRAKDSQLRGQSRSWFEKLEGFIRGGFDDSAPSSKDGAGHGDEGGKAGGLTAAQDKALKEKFAKTFVAAPTDPEANARPCPICKESFKSQWSEDEEEWIWLNAIEVDGAYYHASCHYSAKTLSESVTRRMSSPPGGGRQSTGLLTAGKRGNSRSITPTNPAQRSASVGNPIARLKGEEGVASLPVVSSTTSSGSPDSSRKRKASPSEDDEAAHPNAIASLPPAKKVA